MKQAAEDKQLNGIAQSVEVQFIAVCDFATGGVFHTEKVGFVDLATEAATYLYEAGWRMVGKKLCCPDCFKAREKR